MKNKLTLLIILLLATVISVTAENPPDRQNPIFPRGEVQLTAVNRINDLALILYNIMPTNDQAKVESLFVELDHTDRIASKAECNRQCQLHYKLLKIFGEYLTMAGHKKIAPFRLQCRLISMPMREIIINDVNYGWRYRLHVAHLDGDKTKTKDKEDNDNGHGNDDDGVDESNPGNSKK